MQNIISTMSGKLSTVHETEGNTVHKSLFTNLSKLFGVHCGHIITLAQCQENSWKYIKFRETVHTSLFTKSSKLLGALSILSQEIIIYIATIMKGINRLSCIECRLNSYIITTTTRQCKLPYAQGMPPHAQSLFPF